MRKLIVTESELTNVIEKIIKESILLTEKKVCGWGNGKFNKGGSKCTNRRMQKCWNCGNCNSYEDIDPNEEMGCGGMTTNTNTNIGDYDDSMYYEKKHRGHDSIEDIIRKNITRV